MNVSDLIFSKRFRKFNSEVCPWIDSKMDLETLRNVVLLEEEAWSSSEVPGLLANGANLLVAEPTGVKGEEKVFAGYLCFSSHLDKGMLDVEVFDVVVTEEEQGRGIARAMLQTLQDAVQYLPQHNPKLDILGLRLFLTVSESNKGPIKLYKSFGFNHMTTWQHYYDMNDHGLRMVKPLHFEKKKK